MNVENWGQLRNTDYLPTNVFYFQCNNEYIKTLEVLRESWEGNTEQQPGWQTLWTNNKRTFQVIYFKGLLRHSLKFFQVFIRYLLSLSLYKKNHARGKIQSHGSSLGDPPHTLTNVTPMLDLSSSLTSYLHHTRFVLKLKIVHWHSYFPPGI